MHHPDLGRKEMKIRKNAEIRLSPLADPVRVNMVLSRQDLQRLKIAAVSLETTVNEILRAIVADFLDAQPRPEAPTISEKKELPHM